jgi:hypothetical protein
VITGNAVEALAARRSLTTTQRGTAWGLVSLAAGAAIAAAILGAARRVAILVPVGALMLTLGVAFQLRRAAPITAEEAEVT